MNSETTRTRVPVDWLPAGLLSWYGPDGRPFALVTSWMALFNGQPPRLRAGWPGRRDARSRFWPGGDFVLNIPGEDCLPRVRNLVNQGRVCLEVTDELAQSTACGIHVSAPRLLGCQVQVECCRGRLQEESYEPEVLGEIVLIHRPGASLDPLLLPDLCALNPFSAGV